MIINLEVCFALYELISNFSLTVSVIWDRPSEFLNTRLRIESRKHFWRCPILWHWKFHLSIFHMTDHLLCSNSHLMMCKKDECTKSLLMLIQRFSFINVIKMIIHVISATPEGESIQCKIKQEWHWFQISRLTCRAADKSGLPCTLVQNLCILQASKQQLRRKSIAEVGWRKKSSRCLRSGFSAVHLGASSLPSLPRRSACTSCSSTSPSRELQLHHSLFPFQKCSLMWLLHQPLVSVRLSLNSERRLLASCL